MYKILNELAPDYLQCLFTQRHVNDCKEILAYRISYRKDVLAVVTSNRKQVLAAWRIQAQATRKKPQEVVGLRTQKEVLARPLVLGCTVRNLEV